LSLFRAHHPVFACNVDQVWTKVPFDAIWVVPSVPSAAVDEGSLELTKYPVFSKDCECGNRSAAPGATRH
jgi:hypothetical protein